MKSFSYFTPNINTIFIFLPRHPQILTKYEVNLLYSAPPAPQKPRKNRDKNNLERGGDNKWPTGSSFYATRTSLPPIVRLRRAPYHISKSGSMNLNDLQKCEVQLITGRLYFQGKFFNENDTIMFAKFYNFVKCDKIE